MALSCKLLLIVNVKEESSKTFLIMIVYCHSKHLSI